MTVEEYVIIAINLFKISKKEHIFAHFSTFYWEVVVTSSCFLLEYLLLIYVYIHVKKLTKGADNCVHLK